MSEVIALFICFIAIVIPAALNLKKEHPRVVSYSSTDDFISLLVSIAALIIIYLLNEG